MLSRLTRKFGIRPINREWLQSKDILVRDIIRNPSAAQIYELATYKNPNNPTTAPACVTSTGAFAAYSGENTGRCPLDKRIVTPADQAEDDKIWWGDVNIRMDRDQWESTRERATDYLNSHNSVYCVDGYIGADPEYQYKVRVFTTRSYHALFMQNMMIRPTEDQLNNDFDDVDFTIFNAGEFYARRGTTQPFSRTCVALDFTAQESVILGTQYAGEMKKGLFSLMHHWMPDRDVVSLHSSCTEGEDGDTTLFFGLSGTGKTTLSADPNRLLIGDDEHCWTETGVFNIEGGCYAKIAFLEEAQEPEIYRAVRFGAVVENVKFTDNYKRIIDFEDISITPNTRVAYPIEFIPNAKVPSVGGHPKNIIFLTCDAYGVLPPVAKLTREQAMYHFISGYTCKMAGTEIGVVEPEPIFSACYGEPFLIRHPSLYAEMLAEKVDQHDCNVWMINTGWVNGRYGMGQRISLKDTRAIIDSIHNGSLNEAEYTTTDIFNLEIPTSVDGIADQNILDPAQSWENKQEFNDTLLRLGNSFTENFDKYEGEVSADIVNGGPKL
uniref:phosphoenolpyruvate carboxykinase (ATP) n=1 Tax=Pyropia yezoensis TaxID=2788 RepID=A0A097IUE9_PYRYE|nr:phosphoenolpyruvate carboxykinase [Neopyropia yezoensis]